MIRKTCIDSEAYSKNFYLVYAKKLILKNNSICTIEHEKNMGKKLKIRGYIYQFD